jgi:flagellar hook-length control protein FliK
MNPSLLAVDSVVPGPPGVCSVSPKLSAARNGKQSPIAPLDSSFSSSSPQPTRFDDALREKVVSRISQEGQDKPKLQTNDSNPLADNALGSLPLVTPETSLVDSVDVGEGGAAEIDALSVPEEESEYQNNPAPLINVPSDSGLSLVSLPVSGLNVIKPLMPIPLVVKSEDKPLPIPLNQSVTGAVTADSEQAVEKNLETTNLFNKSPIGENPPPFLSSTEDTGAERLDSTLVSTRPPNRQDVFAGLPGVRTEEAPVPDESAVSDGQKIPQLDSLVPPALGYAQTISANPEGVAARKPIDNKTAAVYKIRILSESADSGGKKSTNNLSSDSASQKLNVAEIQMTSHQTKDPGTSASEINPNFQQILSDNNAQILSQRSPTSQPGNTANTAYQGDLSLSIRKQILESIHSSLSGGDRQISIRLNPPELGKVFIRFQEHDAQITGLLEVSQTQTRYQIEQALPQIIRDLQDSGIQIKRLDVVLTEQTDYHTSQDQSLLDGWSGQHGSAESGTPGGNKSADVWLINNDGYQDSLFHQVQITDDSINILA